MAKAGKKHTNNPSKAEPSPWLLLTDAYDRLHTKFEPSETVQRLSSMPVKKRYVNSGRERILSVEEIDLSWRIDATTGADCLEIHDTEYFHPSVEPEPAEFLVPVAAVARDLEQLGHGNNVTSDYDPIAEYEREVEGRPRTPPRLTPTAPTPAPKKKRREAKRPYRAAAPPSTADAPAVSEVTQDVPRAAQGVDPLNAGSNGRPTDISPSTVPTVHKRPRQSIKETRVLKVLRELDGKCRIQDDMQPAEVEKIVKPHYSDVSRRTIYRAYKDFLKEPPAK